MIITVTLNPALDKTLYINNFKAGTVNRVGSFRIDAGGKGINVSKVIKSLGGYSIALGLLGGQNGRIIKDYLDEEGIENEFHFVAGETRTNIKIVDEQRHENTDINEPGPIVSENDIKRFEAIFKSHLDKKSIVVLSGSVPSGIDARIYRELIELSKKAGAITILDADGDLLKYGAEAGPYLVKPNISELERFFNMKINGLGEAERLGRRLLSSYGIELVVISMGEKGALYINKEYSLFAHTIKVEVKSTVGAGDAMAAALACSIERGCSMEKALTLSMASGIANVMTSGTQAPDPDTIADLEKRIKYERL